MDELTLIGLHDDGEHVLVQGPGGARFRLPIDDALRAAVRRDRPYLERTRAELSGTIPPREIQARIRAGATAEEVAETTGVEVELVRRYDGPVLAEREYVAEQARGTRIGREADAPVLGDLVTDRLATRGVVPDDVRWDAFRRQGAPWTVQVAFRVGQDERSARWIYDATTRSVRADDDEARWLSETELRDEPVPRRHLAAVRGALPTDRHVLEVDVDAALRPLLASVDLPLDPVPDEQPDPTHTLLDDLRDRRGVRQPADEDDEDDEVAFGPQHAFDFERPGATTPVPAAHPPASRPDQAVDATILEMPADYRERRRRAGRAQNEHSAEATGEHPIDGENTTEHTTEPVSTDPSVGPLGVGPTGPQPEPDEEIPPPLAARAKSRKGRASVPSWDEIVFGARPE